MAGAFYEIRKLTPDNYEIDMKGAMPLQSLYISSDIETNYKGTHLNYPNIPTINEILPDAKGELIAADFFIFSPGSSRRG